MAVDASFASLFENLKLEDPWLPPRSWESIPSESGISDSNASASQSSLSRCLYDTSTVSETSLVRLAMNALNGVKSALLSIEKLCVLFCSDPSDRTFHRIPSLWNRSSSTHALGNILKSIGCFGCIVFLLRNFVDYFSNLNLAKNSVRNIRVNSERMENQNDPYSKVEESPYSLVNQAFSVAVGKVLDSYICALDTLYGSVGFRRSDKSIDTASQFLSGVGFLTSVVHSEITLLEVYLHTSELRSQIGALGNMCNVHDISLCFSVLSFEDLVTKAYLEFQNFPRGGDLLTCLYTQLQVVDPVHCVLVKFLFLQSCEPYCRFIRSWIYRSQISDPYKEFVVEYDDNPPTCALGNIGVSFDFPLATIRERDGVAVPCFLEDYSIPLLRAGQQLQVVMKLLELCSHAGAGKDDYEDILPCWSGFSCDCLSDTSPLTFNKGDIAAMVNARNSYYTRMMEKLNFFFTRLEIRFRQVVPHSNIPVLISKDGGSQNIPFSVASLINLSADGRNLNVAVGTMDSETSSSVDGLSCVEDEFASSECLSSNSSEEQNESEHLIKLPTGSFGLDLRYLSTLSFSSSHPLDSYLHKTSQKNISYSMESESPDICEEIDPLDHLAHAQHKRTNLCDGFLPLDLGEQKSSQVSKMQYTDSQHDMGGWLFDSPVKNHFHLDRGFGDDTKLRPFVCEPKVSYTNMRIQKNYISSLCNTNLNVLTEGASNKDQFPESGTFTSLSSVISQPWNFKYDSNFLSLNPMLSKNNLMSKPGVKWFADRNRSFSFFDFLSVEDPCKVYVEKLASGLRQQVQPECSISKKYVALSATGSGNSHCEESCDGDGDDDGVSSDDHMSYVNSPLESKDIKHDDSILANISGGSGGANMLCSPNSSVNFSVGDHRRSLVATFEMPPDFVIDKCLLQEILLQYRFVSKLTIKLLEEGFNLHEHLLALRRYHFMELADWADLFVKSLWRHKWYVTEADHKISEIQGLLELSIQKSSCDRDHNKDQLFVYTKGDDTIPFSASAIGIHSFDFIGLGYKVDWPISIVLTPNALKIYAEIFSFLVQVKLAVLTLTDVWCSLKDLPCLVNWNHHSELHESEVHNFNMLTKLRHQVNHFVTTLQQYVLSQLSHVSWCRFLHSLKTKVKDMMDIESVHMAYLTDSQHICFLSDETKSIARIIESILQCALDLRSCLIGKTCEAGIDGGLPGKLSRINISQVLSIKGIFNKNMRELHSCYLRSPKHVEFGLSCFWDNLNYNSYYSDVGNEICCYGFPI